MIKFDVDVIGDNLGEYDIMSGNKTVYLANIWHELRKSYIISESLLVAKIIDTIIHEDCHEAIDYCLINSDIDEHAIFKLLYC